MTGQAIEFRINAEDPAHEFRPGAGVVERYHAPGGLGVRMDSHLFTGYTIPPFYDSLLAKLIVWGPDRATAIARGRVALDTDHLAPLLNPGGLLATPAIGPATLSVIRELIETGDSSYLSSLREGMPTGLLDLMRVPGLGVAKIRGVHAAPGLQTVGGQGRGPAGARGGGASSGRRHCETWTRPPISAGGKAAPLAPSRFSGRRRRLSSNWRACPASVPSWTPTTRPSPSCASCLSLASSDT